MITYAVLDCGISQPMGGSTYTLSAASTVASYLVLGGIGEGLLKRKTAHVGSVVDLKAQFDRADIISTVTAAPTVQSVGLFGLVVIIRTFLSSSPENRNRRTLALAASRKRGAVRRRRLVLADRPTLAFKMTSRRGRSIANEQRDR